MVHSGSGRVYWLDMQRTLTPGDHPSTQSYLCTRWLFLRLLGLITLAAFTSYWVQIEGLIGSRGITPAVRLVPQLERLAETHGTLPIILRLAPSLFWLEPSDATLHLLCAAGVLASSLLFLNILPGPMLLAAWGLYLSLSAISGIFLGYQWDALLLEVCLLGLFLAPWRFRPRLLETSPPTLWAIWLLRLLLFKLMFLSGAVKLLSRDETWLSLTALEFHFWTQPIPNLLSYYLHQLPAALLSASTFLMFVIELVLPLFIFGPPRLRYAAFVGLAALQAGISLSGSYGFFNALTVVLCLPLLDDHAVGKLAPPRLRDRLPAPTISRPPRTLPSRLLIGAGALLLALASGLPMLETLSRAPLPGPAQTLLAWLEPTRSVNSYGLFAVMTTSRPEIEIEGSLDGSSWRPYRFHWKVDGLERLPPPTGLHMPRLDWQLWFAALEGSCLNARWYPAFVQRLLEGSPEVTGLLAETPFPDRPPVYIRSTLYQYRFTSLEEKEATGDYWKREPEGSYCPTLTLNQGRLMAVEP